MQPGPLPDDCFQDITIAEQALICKMQCFVSLLHLKHGQYAMSGNTIFFWQNLQATATVLPRQQCDIIVFGKLRSGGQITELKVRRPKVEQCLQYLVANNPFYNNIVKDQTILNSLPTDGWVSLAAEINTDESAPTFDRMVPTDTATESGLERFKKIVG